MSSNDNVTPVEGARSAALVVDGGNSGPVQPSFRLGELRELLVRLGQEPREEAAGKFNALSMILADAILDSDEDSLVAAQDGLQRLYAQLLDDASADGENRGRVLAHIDLVQWALRRLPPSSLVAGLEPGSHSRRFLETLAERPGLSNEEIASILGTDSTEVSRVGRRLLRAGAARKRKLGRVNQWELTPRGRTALHGRTPGGRMTLVFARQALRRLAQRVIELADVRDHQPSRKWLPVPSRLFAMILASEDPPSPRQLATATGLAKNVVAAAAGFLVAAGYLRQPGVDRQRQDHLQLADLDRPLIVNEEDYCAIGVKILPDRLIGVVTDLRARKLWSESVVLHDRSPDAVIGAVTALVTALRKPSATNALPRYTIGLGVETGGHIDSMTGCVEISPNLGWEGPVELRERLRRETKLLTFVENDVNALTIHEQLFGSAVDVPWFAAIFVDQGIGCGMVLDGQLAHGHSGLAGEIGHIVIDPDGRECRCTNRGCLESIASTGAIAATVSERLGGQVSFAGAVALAEEGETAAVDALCAAGRALGQAVSILQNLVNPQRILIHVPELLDPKRAGVAAKIFNENLLCAVEEGSFSTAADRCELDIRHLEHSAEYGARGAASAVLRQFIFQPLNWRPSLSAPSTSGEYVAAVPPAFSANPMTMSSNEILVGNRSIVIQVEGERDFAELPEKLVTELAS